MTDHFGKVLHFPNARRDTLTGSTMVLEHAHELNELAVALKSKTGEYSVAFYPPPAGAVAWEIQSAEQLENLGRYLIQLAALMRLEVAGVPV